MSVRTGLWWFDIIVWVVSGGAFMGLCYYVPKVIHEQSQLVREQYHLWFGRGDGPPESD